MKKITVFALICLIIGGAVFAWSMFSADRRNGKRTSVQVAGQSSVRDERDGRDDSPKVMSIEGLEISHGEAGKVLWTFHAKEARMAEEGGVIYANEPFLTYFMHPVEPEASHPPRDTIVTVKSVTGDLNQETNDMRFIENVVVVNEEKTMLADALNYSGAEKSLTSEGRTLFSSPGMDGEADRVIWDLNTDTMYASGDVVVNWENVSK